MSVFEDLIEELKEENLLETTAADQNSAGFGLESSDAEGNPDSSASAGEIASLFGVVDEDGNFDLDLPQIEKPSSEKEFFRKRAMDEVSSLQMVEHVLSGVEREHIKVSPVAYDDLDAKKALHKFLQVSGGVKSPEHSEAEYALRQETEAWSLALLERDAKISVSNIRRFCEDSRPVLSSAALISLARFYRNSPFSEDVRSKFDFVMTRLFSRDADEDSRRLLFPRVEMEGHITVLYSNWSSLALYSSPQDQSHIDAAATQFGAFSSEVEAATNFDELLNADFFNRVRLYKQEAAEIFFVPEVTAAAIECNLRVGNRYVELIDNERIHNTVEAVEEKYGYTYDQVVSNAVGKTLLLVDLLKSRTEDDGPPKPINDPVFQKSVRIKPAPRETSESRSPFFGINKWLAAAAFLCILASVGVYLWAESAVGDESAAAVAAPVKIDDPDVKQYLRSLRSSQETLFAVAQPSFEALARDDQTQFLEKVLVLANGQNLRRVNVLNNKGRSIAFASKGRIEIVDQ